MRQARCQSLHFCTRLRTGREVVRIYLDKVGSGSNGAYDSCEVTQTCPTLSDPMDCSPPGSSVHGIFQARALEWGAIAFSDL